ncbi:MAG: hypothetical protein FWG73_01115 [Planctomycetaceae bacterium]|nr:hypothetical protein [Planctomycetaceae bacterium]
MSKQVGCRPPGGIVGASRLEACSATVCGQESATPTHPPGGRLPTFSDVKLAVAPPHPY